MADFPVTVGEHGSYQWLVADYDIDDLLRLVPEIVLGKYVAITSIDSSPLTLTERERTAGWVEHGGIAYSPIVALVTDLPHDCYDEWWVFERLTDMGQLAPQGTKIFETKLSAGEIYAFVNWPFGPHLEGDMAPLVELFWKQFDQIKPQSYIAENDTCLSVVTEDVKLFRAVHEALLSLKSYEKN